MGRHNTDRIMEGADEVALREVRDTMTKIDKGKDGVRGLQNLSRLMSSHGHGNRPCPRCDMTNLEGSSPIDHALEVHLGRWGMDKAY